MSSLRPPVELLRLALRYAYYLTEPMAKPYLAWGRLGQIIRALHPTQAFDLACHLIRELPSSYLRSFGGGTLAHLIQHHGTILIDWIEGEAWRDVDFLEALSNSWIAREEVDPAVLARLRLATGSRIHIVTRPERDASYKAMFEHWITRRPRRRTPGRKPKSHSRSSAGESIAERFAFSRPEPAAPPTWPDAPNAARQSEQSMWCLRWIMPLAQLHFGLPSRSRVVQDTTEGPLIVSLHWLRVTEIAGRLALPTLVVVLGITSMSPITDLVWVAGSFVLAIVGAALAGMAMGVISQRLRQFAGPMVYLVLSLGPYLTIIALLSRTEHGLIVAPAVVGGAVSLPFIGRFLRKARLRLSRARILHRQATAKT